MDQNLLFSSELFSKGYGFMPKLVAKDQDLSIEAKAIYSYLASYSGAGLSSFPSTSLILHDLGISENRYLKHRKTLVDKGYLTIKRERLDNGFSKNIYIINQNPSEVVHLNSVHLQNVGIGNVGIGNEGTISNSFKSNNINSNSNNKKILSSSDEQDASSKKSRKKVYEENSPYYQLALLLLQEINKKGEIKEPNLQTWSDDMRKLVELDKKEIKLVEQIIVWSQASDFWSKNILSAAKLRKQFDMLVRQSGLSKPQVSQEEKDYGWE